MIVKYNDVLVTRNNTGNGIFLRHVSNDTTIELHDHQAVLWLQWNETRVIEKPRFIERLRLHGFIRDIEYRGYQILEQVDNYIPKIQSKNIKWYKESPELYILFNTDQMPQNNPLLVLNSCGSIIWNLILEKSTIGMIRKKIITLFGIDDVLSFLRKLAVLGFINHFPEYKNSTEEIIRKDVNPSVLQSRIFQAGIPWYCLWEICTICNQQCRICYLKDISSPPLPDDRIRSIIREIADLGVFYVSIMGGEPLLLPHPEKIVRELRGYGIYVKIITNGITLTKQMAQSLNRSGLNHIEISFDGLSVHTHEASRGSGSFKKAVDAIKNASDGGIPRIGIVLSVYDRNLHEVKQLPGFMNDHHIKECYISLFKKTGLRGCASPFEPLSVDEVEQLHHLIEDWKIAYPDLTITLLSYCTCGRTSVIIGAQGDVRPCSFSNKSHGNIFQMSLKKIWDTMGRKLPESGPFGFCTQD